MTQTKTFGSFRSATQLGILFLWHTYQTIGFFIKVHISTVAVFGISQTKISDRFGMADSRIIALFGTSQPQITESFTMGTDQNNRLVFGKAEVN